MHIIVQRDSLAEQGAGSIGETSYLQTYTYMSANEGEGGSNMGRNTEVILKLRGNTEY